MLAEGVARGISWRFLAYRNGDGDCMVEGTRDKAAVNSGTVCYGGYDPDDKGCWRSARVWSNDYGWVAVH